MRRWVELAAQLDANGMPRSEIARLFGVSPPSVTQALNKYVEPPPVPHWVPDAIVSDYRRISVELGERSAKRWAMYWASQQ